MRIPTVLFGLCLVFSVPIRLQAVDPGAQQDAEAAREKLLKAADQLDNIQANSETTRTSVDGMKADVTKLQGDVTKLQADNATLRQQLADLQAALDEEKAARLKDRQALIDNVADLIASSKSAGGTKTNPKKKTTPAPDTASSESSTPSAPPSHPAPDAETTPSTPSTSAGTASGSLAPPPETTPVKPQKGYYHVVAGGETLTLICEAYKQQGVNVSVSQIRKANWLTDKSVLKVGQKLFIPKPAN